MSDNQRPGNWQQNPQGPQRPNPQQGNPQQYGGPGPQPGGPQQGGPQQYGPGPQPQQWQQQAGPQGPGYGPQGQGPQGYGPQGPQGQQAPVKKKSKAPLIVAAVVALGLLVGGGFLIASLLGGSTPAAAKGLPANSLAAIELNLNPSAGQKLAVKEFAEKFPALADEVGDVEGDYKEALWNVIPDSEDKPDWSEIEPWLGDSLAMAVLDIEDEAFVVSVQVTDTDAARAFAEAEFAGDVSVDFIDDLMIISDIDSPVDVEAIESSALADNETYSADMAKLGTDYLATGWVSEELVNQAIEASEGEVGIETAGITGHGAAGFKIEDGMAVLRGISKSDHNVGDAELDDDFVDSLPAGGLGVLATAFSSEAIDLIWEQLQPTYEQDPAMFDQLGITSSEDLAAVLGSQLALTFSWEGQMPSVGIKVETDDPAKHQQVLETLAGFMGIPDVQHSTDGNVVHTTWGMSPDQLANPAEQLGDNEAFDDVTETSGDTQSVLWVDVPALLGNQALGLGNTEEARNLEPISGVGISGSTLDDGYAEFFVRVGTK